MNARLFAPFLLSLAMLAPSPAAAQRGSETVLLLGVQRGGKVDSKLTHSLYDALAKSGESMVKENALAAGERLCGNEECLSQLASREGAKVVLGVQLQDTSPTSQYVTMLLFDVERRVPSEERTICDKCTPTQLLSALVDLSDRSLRSFRDKRTVQGQTQAAGTPAPALPPGTEGAASSQPGTAPPLLPATSLPSSPGAGNGDAFSRWSPRRKVAAGVLTGLLVAALIPTIALHVTDGQDTSVLSCGDTARFCRLQNLPLYATGYAISGALAIGLGITFLWPTAKPTTASQSVQITTEAK